MFKKGFTSIVALLIILPLIAQKDARTSSFSHTIDTLDGLFLHTYSLGNNDFSKSNQMIFVLEIPNSSTYYLSFEYEKRRTKTSDMATKHDAAAAINGSFFDMDNHFPICYLRIDSIQLGENTPGKDTINRKYYQYGTICIEKDSVFILKTESSRKWEESLHYRNIMTSGPLLIINHEKQKLRTDRTFVTHPHNRTALGIRDDGTLLLLVADGRSTQAVGLSLYELQNFMEYLNCKDAINLDGGGSSTLFLNLGNKKGIINHPSDNNKFDKYGERAVSNAILVLKNSNRNI